MNTTRIWLACAAAIATMASSAYARADDPASNDVPTEGERAKGADHGEHA